MIFKVVSKDTFMVGSSMLDDRGGMKLNNFTLVFSTEQVLITATSF